MLGPSLSSEFGLSAAQLGLLTGMYFFSIGLFQIPLGVLLDRYGPRKVNGALLVVGAAGSALFAVAGSYPELVVARALIGLGVSACLMAAFQAFVLWFPPERTATMIALAYSMGGLGAMSASVPLELALRVFSWREIFLALAAVTLALSAAFALWVPEHPMQRKPASVRAQLDGLARIARDGAFWRIAVALGANQCAVVSLFTLWMTAWLRDVAGFDSGEAALAFGWVAIPLTLGYLVFGRVADNLARRGHSPLPLLMGGMALGLVFFGPIAFGVTTGAVALWSGFVFCGTGATLAHSIATRRYPREMAGRVNTVLNMFTFVGTFLGQWGAGVILSAWPPTAGGYSAEAYTVAFGTLWVVMAAGLAWLWGGRKKLTSPSA